MSYNFIAAALTWEIINDEEDIGCFKLVFDNGDFKNGKGFKEFLSVASSISNDINVIYVKNLTWFLHIARKFIDFNGKDFFASNVSDFYYMKLSDNIEVRNWDKFWGKIDNGEEFLKRLSTCRKTFKVDCKNELGLENHFKYTLAKDMWEDIKYKYYLKAGWAISFCEELVPKTEEELDTLENLYKGGFYYCNSEYYGKIAQNVHCYDISSAYLSYLARKKFPCSGFTKVEGIQEISSIIKEKKQCWYGTIVFFDLDYRINFPVDLQKFGYRDRINDKECWILTLTNVDMEWFKQVFKWDKNVAILNFYCAPQKELCKNYARMFQELYDYKNAQKKGTFAKEIFKFRAELPYGQPMKDTRYSDKVVYNEAYGFMIVDNNEKPFKQIQNSIIKRGIPMQVSYWVAAYARLEFFTVLNRIGLDNVVYGDIDSVKFIGLEGIKVIEERNNEIKEEFKVINKKRILDFDKKLGQWCNEGDVAGFKAVGIKWYITVDMERVIDVKAAGAEKETLLEWVRNQTDPLGKFSLAMSVPNLFKDFRVSKKNKFAVYAGYKQKISNDLIKELKFNGTKIYNLFKEGI